MCKKIYDVEYSDIFMSKSHNGLSHNAQKYRRFVKHMANRAVRRSNRININIVEEDDDFAPETVELQRLLKAHGFRVYDWIDFMESDLTDDEIERTAMWMTIDHAKYRMMKHCADDIDPRIVSLMRLYVKRHPNEPWLYKNY